VIGADDEVGDALVRDRHVTGFSSTAAAFSEGQFNDGGVVFGPGGVLFYTRYPVNELGQIEPGSSTNDWIIDLDTLMIDSSVGVRHRCYTEAGR
jgi:hypothetical protein